MYRIAEEVVALFCPSCGTSFENGDTRCSNCQAILPIVDSDFDAPIPTSFAPDASEPTTQPTAQPDPVIAQQNPFTPEPPAYQPPQQPAYQPPQQQAYQPPQQQVYQPPQQQAYQPPQQQAYQPPQQQAYQPPQQQAYQAPGQQPLSPYAQHAQQNAPRNFEYFQAPPPKPSNFLAGNIIMTVVNLCLCVGFIPGVVGIIMSGMSISKYNNKNYEGAVANGKAAKIWFIVSLILTILTIISTIIFTIYVTVAGTSVLSGLLSDTAWLDEWLYGVY